MRAVTLHGPLALYFRSLPFSIVLNRYIIRLVIVFITKAKIVTAVASLTTKAMFL